MDSWRRKKSENYNQEGSRMRSQSRNPPGNWQATIPTWEKRFCWEIGAVPWRKLLETKKIIHTYDNILKWDDSACEEAFHNAKARYWAGLNGLQCDVPFPDPNAHIDDVNWDSNIDSELILDLSRDYVVSNDSNKGEKVLIFGNTYAKSQGLTDNGWGEAEDGFKIVTDTDLEKIREESYRIYADMASADVASVDVAAKGIDHGGAWDVEDRWEKKVEENGWNCDSGWNKWESKVNKFGNYRVDNGYNGNYMSRYKTTRFYGDESKVNDFGRDGNNGGGYNGNYRENAGRYISREKATRFNCDNQVNKVWERNNRNGRRRENFGRPNWGWEKSVWGL